MKISYCLLFAVGGANSFNHAPSTSRRHLSPAYKTSILHLSFDYFTSKQKQPFRSLSSTDDQVGETPLEKEVVSPEKIAARKKRVFGGYKILGSSYALVSALILAKGPLNSGLIAASGPFLASSICWILLGAAKNDRLSSETYKRLNISLFEYGLVGVFVGILLKLNPLWTVSCFIAVVNSIKGYGYGLKGWELSGKSFTLAKEDLIRGTKNSVKTMVIAPNLKSVGYLAATATVGILKFSKLFEAIRMATTGYPKEIIGNCILRLSGFVLLTHIMFSLKDAADRNRLEGTTFVQLNAVSSFSFVAMAVAAYAEGTRVVLWTSLGFSVMTMLYTVLSILKKK